MRVSRTRGLRVTEATHRAESLLQIQPCVVHTDKKQKVLKKLLREKRNYITRVLRYLTRRFLKIY